MATEAQKMALRRYYVANKAKRKQVVLWLDRKSDADIIEHIAKQPNRSQYIRDALRSYIESHA